MTWASHHRPARSRIRRRKAAPLPGLAVLVGLLVLSAPRGDAGPGPSFRNEIIPILSKHGCNSGGCHGALAGKGGFRLSLFGYDPEGDYHAITREARGRRIEPSDPGRSLLLTKATTALKHTGGKRIEPGSDDYRTLAAWISAGCPPPREDDPRLASLEVEPARATLAPGDSATLAVHARDTDGRRVDVTRWARFSSADEAVATVDEDGTVTIVGRGEGAVTAWFSSRIAMARLSVPFDNELAPETFADAPRRNFIDDHALAQLERLRIPPSPRATDAMFLRRVFLDTAGILPTPEETRAFLADDSPGKRDALIESLLAREEFVDYWTYRWADVFLVTGRQLRPDAVAAYHRWIRGHVAANTPWNEFARQLVTATGSSVENGATNFYAVHQDPESMAENVSQSLLSLSINCAKCHNHPLEKWTNDQYYAFANLFARVRAKGWGGDARSGDGHRTVYTVARGDLVQPRTGKARPPAPLDAPPIDPADPRDRREILADWLTAPENELFARSVVNRIWAAFFGAGLVDPVDDLRESNPPSNPPLLEALAGFLVENGYDLRAVMRAILQSETYQRSSEPVPGNEGDTRHLSRYQPRRLMAEVLHDAIAAVTGVPTAFTRIALSDGSTAATDFYPAGTRALQLYDSAVDSYFLETFGRNPREISCECERSNQPSLVQVLHVANGKTLNEKLAAEEGIVGRLLAESDDAGAIVDAAFLRCLARPPTTAEREGFVSILDETKGDEKRAAVEDLFWSLMSSREFLFQH